MFGKNTLYGPAKEDEPLWVQEVFPTIQGEGPLAGSPAVFVRLAGCNLRCHFCDTDFESSTWHPDLTELLMAIGLASDHAKGRLVVLTGGEPLRQRIGDLMLLLINRGYHIQIETAGTLWSDDLEEILQTYRSGITIVCSPKTETVNKRMANWCRDYKYIMRQGEAIAPEDGLPLDSTQEIGRIARLYRPPLNAGCEIWLQPCAEYTATGALDEKATFENAQYAAKLCMAYGYRLSLQIHKLLGLP